MLSLTPVADRSEVEKLFNENNIPCPEGAGAFVCREGGRVIAWCLYSLKKEIAVLAICCDDESLLDGLIRATLNFALLNGAETADFSRLPASCRKNLAPLGFLDPAPLSLADCFARPCRAETTGGANRVFKNQ